MEVKFISGKKAILTTYEGEGESEENWEMQESIILSDYKTKVRESYICMYVGIASSLTICFPPFSSLYTRMKCMH